MSLSLPSSVVDAIRASNVDRVLFVEFPDPKGSTSYWTDWTKKIDATVDGVTNTYNSRDIEAPDLKRVLHEQLSEIQLRIENVGGDIGDIVTDNSGLYGQRVKASSFSLDNTADGDVITLDDWSVETVSWNEVEAKVKIVPELWIQDEDLTETADRDRFPLADAEDTINFQRQGRVTPRSSGLT